MDPGYARPVMLLPLLLACAGKDDSAQGDTGPEEVLLAPPWFVLIAPVAHGTLKSTCTLGVEVYDNDAPEVVVDSVSFNARGDEWHGFPIEAGRTYRADLSWDECWNAGEETGTYESSIFSTEEGAMVVAWYTGSLMGVNVFIQEEDYRGGQGTVTLDEDGDPATLIAAAQALGVTTSGSGPDFELSFSGDLPVAEVMTGLTTVEGWLGGTPDWRRQPDWW